MKILNKLFHTMLQQLLPTPTGTNQVFQKPNSGINIANYMIRLFITNAKD